jgi:hypothetical protein
LPDDFKTCPDILRVSRAAPVTVEKNRSVTAMTQTETFRLSFSHCFLLRESSR